VSTTGLAYDRGNEQFCMNYQQILFILFVLCFAEIFVPPLFLSRQNYLYNTATIICCLINNCCENPITWNAAKVVIGSTSSP
jgi:hypothetical protein